MAQIKMASGRAASFLTAALIGLAISGCAGPSRADTLDLRTDCGAVGDGKADDSQALKTCLTKFQTALTAGRPTVLRISAGIYRITGAHGAMPTIEKRGGTITGDGPHASYLVLDPSYSGDLFSWSEAWMSGHLAPPSYDPAQDMSGPTITGLQITGSTAAANRQNAFVFYDRIDNVLIRDVEVDFLNGQCLSMGKTLRQAIAYVRESAFFNLKCFNTGAAQAPAVEISSTTAQGSDASNELDFYKLAIFATKGDGLVIRNPNKASATRGIRMFGVRVESAGADAVVIGAASDQGQVSNIGLHDLNVLAARGAALRIGAGAGAPPPRQISVFGGHLGPNDGASVVVDSGRMLDIDLDDLDRPVRLGPRAGDNIDIHGNGPRAAAAAAQDGR